MTLSSALFAALVGLVLLYLVPNRARTRQVLLESRQDDRFSPELRIIARTSKSSGRRKSRETTPKGTQITAAAPRCGYVLTQTSPPEKIMMRRPNVVAERLAAQNAAERRRRRDQLQRRAAAARRRLGLTVALLLASVITGGLAGFGVFAAGFIAIPVTLTGAVLVLGRRAVVLNTRADARYERLQRARAVDLAAAEQPKEPAAKLEQPVEEPDAVAEPEPVVEVAPETEKTWTPVPVPAPTYTMKPAAPRMEPAPLDLPEPDYVAPGAKLDESDAAAGAEATGSIDAVGSVDAAVGAQADARSAPAERVGAGMEHDTAAAEASIDLDAILDRRRAAGA